MKYVLLVVAVTGMLFVGFAMVWTARRGVRGPGCGGEGPGLVVAAMPWTFGGSVAAAAAALLINAVQ